MGVGLWVEEDLGVQDAVGVCAREVFIGQGLEVRGGDEHGHADEVVVQEVVEGGEAQVAVFERGGGREGGVDGGVRESYVVGGCEAEEQGW